MIKLLSNIFNCPVPLYLYSLFPYVMLCSLTYVREPSFIDKRPNLGCSLLLPTLIKNKNCQILVIPQTNSQLFVVFFSPPDCFPLLFEFLCWRKRIFMKQDFVIAIPLLNIFLMALNGPQRKD